MFQKGNAILIIIIILTAALGGWYWYSQNKNQDGDMLACPQDAKICPDGSAVGRTGPNCEFAACPNNVRSSDSTNTGNAETTNWKTYRNDEYGFEMKYPAEFSVNEQHPQDQNGPNYPLVFAEIVPPYRSLIDIKLSINEGQIEEADATLCITKKTTLGKQNIPVTKFSCGDAGHSGSNYSLMLRKNIVLEIIVSSVDRNNAKEIPENIIQELLGSLMVDDLL